MRLLLVNANRPKMSSCFSNSSFKYNSHHIGVIATIVVHTGNGPMWYWVEAQTQICKENWWTNLLYVNNLVRTNAVVSLLIADSRKTLFKQFLSHSA